MPMETENEAGDEAPMLVVERAVAATGDAAFILPCHCGLEQAGCDFRSLGVDGQAKALANERVSPKVKAAWVEWFRAQTQEGK